MSRPTVARSELAGWAGYGYCASHSRFYWGLKLYLVCTPVRMPILWALADPKIGEREVLSAMLEVDAAVTGEHDGILLICDNLEDHGGRSVEGVAVRVAQRILAMAAAIWHNHTIGAPVTRSLIAYDHQPALGSE